MHLRQIHSQLTVLTLAGTHDGKTPILDSTNIIILAAVSLDIERTAPSSNLFKKSNFYVKYPYWLRHWLPETRPKNSKGSAKGKGAQVFQLIVQSDATILGKIRSQVL